MTNSLGPPHMRYSLESFRGEREMSYAMKTSSVSTKASNEVLFLGHISPPQPAKEASSISFQRKGPSTVLLSGVPPEAVLL